MARCSNCKKFILGGKKQGDLRFCGDDCYLQGYVDPLIERNEPVRFKKRLHEFHERNCPLCGGEGPIDVHTSYSCFSFVAITIWSQTPRISCANCGAKSIFRGMALTAVFGWWGFPFGLIMTPVQLARGFRSLTANVDGFEPSAEFERMVKLEIGPTLASSFIKPVTVQAMQGGLLEPRRVA